MDWFLVALVVGAMCEQNAEVEEEEEEEEEDYYIGDDDYAGTVDSPDCDE